MSNNQKEAEMVKNMNKEILNKLNYIQKQLNDIENDTTNFYFFIGVFGLAISAIFGFCGWLFLQAI